MLTIQCLNSKGQQLIAIAIGKTKTKHTIQKFIKMHIVEELLFIFFCVIKCYYVIKKVSKVNIYQAKDHSHKTNKLRITPPYENKFYKNVLIPFTDSDYPFWYLQTFHTKMTRKRNTFGI